MSLEGEPVVGWKESVHRTIRSLLKALTCTVVEILRSFRIMDFRSAALVVIAFALLVGGTISTGILPSAAPYQAFAGGMIVAAFGLVFYIFRP